MPEERNDGRAAYAKDSSGVFRMCEEDNERQSDSCNNTEIKNFFNEDGEENDS